MHIRKLQIFFIIALTLGAVSVQSGTLTKEFHKTIDFPAGGDVMVKNTNGKIEMTSWDRQSVEVYAEIKIKGSGRDAKKALDQVNIIVDRSGDRLRITPEYPDRRKGNGFWDWILGSHSAPYVDFYIKVPRETNPVVQSTNGGIKLSEINGETDAGTVNGGIKMEDMKGSVDASTTNGSITVEVLRFNASDEIDLNTTNGAIKVNLPSQVKAYVKASTVNGAIHSDFELTIKGKILKKRLRGKINGGGGTIDLGTVNGSISINEL